MRSLKKKKTIIRQELTPIKLSQRIDRSVGTLKNWRILGTGPRFIKRGGLIYYPVNEVEKWEQKQNRIRQSTQES